MLQALEAEGTHRRTSETTALAQQGRLVDAQVFVMKFGAISAAVVAVAGFIVAGLLASHGQYVPAAIVGGGELIGLTVLGLRRPMPCPATAPPDED